MWWGLQPRVLNCQVEKLTGLPELVVSNLYIHIKFLLILSLSCALVLYQMLCDTDHWSAGYISVSGAEEIYIGGQRLRVIFAPVIFFHMYVFVKSPIARNN